MYGFMNAYRLQDMAHLWEKMYSFGADDFDAFLHLLVYNLHILECESTIWEIYFFKNRAKI